MAAKNQTPGGPPAARWRDAILVCGKCCKRHDDGKALRRTLKRAARDAAAPGARAPRIVKTACLKLCPKRAIVVASAATLARGEVLLARTEAEVAAAVPRLLPARSPGGDLLG